MKHASGGQSVNVIRGVTEFGHDFAVVGAKIRRQPPHRRRRYAEPSRWPGLADGPKHNVVMHLYDAVDDDLLIIQQLDTAEHRRAGHILGPQTAQDLYRGPFCELRAHYGPPL